MSIAAESWPPPHSRPLVSFEVSGDPKGAGSKDAIPLGRWVTTDGRRRFKAVYREGGVPIVNVVDTSDKTGGPEWRAEIRSAFALAVDAAYEIADAPIAVRVTFYTPGAKGRYGTGRNAGVLKESADKFPHRAELADGTKLARALEDALNSLAWVDDRRVCDLWWSRRFGKHPGARVDLFTMPVSVADYAAVEMPALFEGDPSVIMGGDACEADHEGDREAARGRAADRRDGRGGDLGDQGVELWPGRAAALDDAAGGGHQAGVFPL